VGDRPVEDVIETVSGFGSEIPSSFALLRWIVTKLESKERLQLSCCRFTQYHFFPANQDLTGIERVFHNFRQAPGVVLFMKERRY
jgi:hypothetical protein